MKTKQRPDAKRNNITGPGIPSNMPQPGLDRNNMMPVEVFQWLNTYARKEGRQ